MVPSIKETKDIIATAKGEKEGSLLLKNAQVVNVFTGEIEKADVIIAGRYIAGLGTYKRAKRTIDLKNKYLLPGLMDAHIHLESTLLTPGAFAAAVLPHGTTTVFIDPHEIANVLGMKGLEYILKTTEGIWLNVFVLIPSCVPATDLETSGARITEKEIKTLLGHPRVVGLAEMMNYPGVLSQDESVLTKMAVIQRQRLVIDGHAPLLKGHLLQAYVGAGIDADHEASELNEAQEKLSAGMWLMLREGSAAQNLLSLLSVVNSFNFHRCLFCTDDIEASHLLERGHIDAIVKKAIKAGLNPVWAIKMASLNVAQRFGIKRLGAVAPGYLADLIVVDDLDNFNIEMSIKEGEVVFEYGVLKVQSALEAEQKTSAFPEVVNTIRIADSFFAEDTRPQAFKLSLEGSHAHVIGLLEGQIITQHLIKEVKKDHLGNVVSDPERDILKLAVVERHRASGRIGLGLLSGLGLKQGAVAQSVAHDSHNIIVVGTNDEDMWTAVKALKRMQGGFVVVKNRQVRAGLALPIAGLISPLKAEEVAMHLRHLHKELKLLGVKLAHPFLSLSFVALPVIPSLRLTDKGLVDVEKFEFISLEAS